MDAVWAAGTPVTVRDVLGRLERDPVPAYTTVQTVMDVLFRKGWLTRVKRGRVNVYGAAASRQAYVSGLMEEALGKAEDRTVALVRFVEGMDPEENAALRRLLSVAKTTASDPATGRRGRAR